MILSIVLGVWCVPRDGNKMRMKVKNKAETLITNINSRYKRFNKVNVTID